MPSGLLSNGLHTITATYVPDSNNLASSDGLRQLINPLGVSTPPISLTATVNLVHRGQMTTLQVTVSPQGVGPTPTGLVLLVEDDTVLGGAELTLNGSGQASLDIVADTLPIGEHTIMAVYEGDGNYAGVIAVVKVNRTPKPR